jgi:hypothetical protein
MSKILSFQKFDTQYNLFVYIKSHSKFNGKLQWDFTPFFGLRELKIAPKLETAEGLCLLSF